MKTIVLAVLVATALSAHGQVRKCIGDDGKVTYSDFVCAKNTSAESGVRTGSNTIDTSGYRQEAQRMRNDKAVNTALQTEGEKCKFSYYVYSDSHGKTLADAAKQECLNNIKAKALGQPTSLEAYGFWKDHRAQASASRQTQVQQNQSLTCRRSIAGNALNCTPW